MAVLIASSSLPAGLVEFGDVPLVAAPFFVIAFWLLFSFFFSWHFVLNVQDHGKLTRYQLIKATGAGTIISLATPISGAFSYTSENGFAADYGNIDPWLTVGMFFLCIWAALQFNDKHWRYTTWRGD